MDTKDMNIFYIGINPRYQMFKWLPETLNVMYSAAGFWDNGKWRKNKKWPSRGKKFLDFGGYTLLNQYGKYPFTTTNAANLVIRLKPDYFATLDYPCEPEISRQLGLMTNWERIKKTVYNAALMLEMESELPGQCVPVIQGYSLVEYLDCLDLHKEFGTIREYMAVGSMCRRISNRELNQLIPGIYHRAKWFGVKRLHFFGLKLSPDLIPLYDYIHSRDSAVALDAYNPELRARRDGARWPRNKNEKKEAFLDFFLRLDSLGLQYK